MKCLKSERLYCVVASPFNFRCVDEGKKFARLPSQFLIKGPHDVCLPDNKFKRKAVGNIKFELKNVLFVHFLPSNINPPPSYSLSY